MSHTSEPINVTYSMREGGQLRRSTFSRLDEHRAELSLFPEQIFQLLLQDCALIRDILYYGRMMALERHSLLVTAAFFFHGLTSADKGVQEKCLDKRNMKRNRHSS